MCFENLTMEGRASHSFTGEREAQTSGASRCETRFQKPGTAPRVHFLCPGPAHPETGEENVSSTRLGENNAQPRVSGNKLYSEAIDRPYFLSA